MLRPERTLSGTDVFGLDDLNVRVARAVTRQAKENTTILCPCCKSKGVGQTLTVDDETPEVLVCPACSLQFFVSVNGWPHHYRHRSVEDWKRHIDIEGRVTNGRNRL